MHDQTIRRLTGFSLILIPILFMAAYTLLAITFNYPGILREPAGQVMTQFAAGGNGLIAIWYAFALSTLLFIPLVLLLHYVLNTEIAPSLTLAIATVFGVIAGVVQALGLMRWPFLVPLLSDLYLDPAATPESQAAAVTVFAAFNRYAGVAVGEHMGYLFTGLWTVLVARTMVHSAQIWRWLPWLGLVSGAGILIGVTEPLLSVAGLVNAAGYTVWAVWLLLCGVALLQASAKQPTPS